MPRPTGASSSRTEDGPGVTAVTRYSAWREKNGYSSSFQAAPAMPSAAHSASHSPAGETSAIGDLKLSQCSTTTRNSGPDSLCHQRQVP